MTSGSTPSGGHPADPPAAPGADPGADPLGVASPLDAAEEDPDAAATAALPGHGVDEVVDEAPGTSVQEPQIGRPAQDHPR